MTNHTTAMSSIAAAIPALPEAAVKMAEMSDMGRLSVDSTQERGAARRKRRGGKGRGSKACRGTQDCAGSSVLVLRLRLGLRLGLGLVLGLLLLEIELGQAEAFELAELVGIGC